MWSNKKVVGVILSITTATVLSACGTTTAAQNSSGHKPYTIAFINGDNIDPYFLTAWHGAYVEAKKLGVKLIENAPASFDYEQQAPIIEDMIARHVNAIILSADSGTALQPELLQAHKAGIPVIIVNQTQADMNNTPYALSFISTSNTELSRYGAQAMHSLIGGSGTTAVINSTAGLTSDIHRGTGYYAWMKSHAPGIKVLPMQFDQDSRSKADAIATDLMKANPQLKGIFAVDSFTGQGVGVAIKAAGKAGQIKLVAIDAEPQEVTLMKQGIIQELIAQQPYHMGALAMQYAVDAITGHKSLIQRNVAPPPIIVTPKNLSHMGNVVYQAWHP
jgi:ribose transport system substrate-binding protein